MAGEADAVVLDLEDSVPPDRKDEARAHAVKAVAATWPKPLWLRINQVRLPHGQEDLEALAGAPVQGLRLPSAKAPTTSGPYWTGSTPRSICCSRRPSGWNAPTNWPPPHRRWSCSPCGEADLAADLRVNVDEALDWARARTVNAARAAGLSGPVQSVWTQVADLDGLKADTERARAYGFFGRSVVHPRQVPPVNAAFTPEPEEVEDARRLVDSLHRAQRAGNAAWLDDRGRFVDPAVVARARWLLELAG